MDVLEAVFGLLFLWPQPPSPKLAATQSGGPVIKPADFDRHRANG
jgi:hypothetical protein